MRDELSAGTGYSKTRSSFQAAISSLRRDGLVEADRDELRASGTAIPQRGAVSWTIGSGSDCPARIERMLAIEDMHPRTVYDPDGDGLPNP